MSDWRSSIEEWHASLEGADECTITVRTRRDGRDRVVGRMADHASPSEIISAIEMDGGSHYTVIATRGRAQVGRLAVRVSDDGATYDAHLRAHLDYYSRSRELEIQSLHGLMGSMIRQTTRLGDMIDAMTARHIETLTLLESLLRRDAEREEERRRGEWRREQLSKMWDTIGPIVSAYGSRWGEEPGRDAIASLISSLTDEQIGQLLTVLSDQQRAILLGLLEARKDERPRTADGSAGANGASRST